MTRSTLAAFAPFLLLGGCLGLGGKPPAYQLTLTPAAMPPVGQTQTAAITAPGQTVALKAGGQSTTLAAAVPPAVGSASLTVESLVAPAEISVTRVPVNDGGHITYLKGGQWVEPPARLFARLIGDTVTVRTGRVVLSSAQSFATGSARLTGELRQFGIDASGPVAVVTFDATLIRARGGAIEKQRFEARAPVNAIDPAAAGVALNTAANQVAQQVADWVGR